MCSESCAQQQGPLTEGPLFVWRAVLTLLPMLVTLMLLPVIAFANPPDPSWIAGIYDGADGDDVVMSVDDTVATSVGRQAHDKRLPSQGEILFEQGARCVSKNCLTCGPRGPPLAQPMASSHVFVLPDSTPQSLAEEAPFPPSQALLSLRAEAQQRLWNSLRQSIPPRVPPYRQGKTTT